MSDEYDVYIEQSGFTLDLEIETGAAGATGPAGPGFASIPASTILGNNTGASALPVGLTVSQIMSMLPVLPLAGGTVTGLQSFSGTDTPGLQLKSLTSAQITALASASALPNGSILIDSTTSRVDVRLNGVTEELIDTRGGQAINGALTLANSVLTVRKINNSTDAFVSFQANNLTQQVDIGYQFIGVSGANANVDMSVLKKGTNGNVWLGSGTAGQGIRFNADDASNTVWFGARNVGITANSGQTIFLGQTSSSTVGVSIATATGNLTASGTVQVPNGTVSAPTHAFSSQPTSGFYLAATSYIGLTTAGIARWVSGPSSAGTQLNVLECIGMSVNPGTTDASVSIGRTSTAGLAQIGSGGNNASGSLNLTNLTASGTVTGNTILVGGVSGLLLKNSNSQIQARNNADTDDASFRSGTYHLGGDLGLHPVASGSSTASVFWKFRIFGNCGSNPTNFPGTGNLGNGLGRNSCHCEIVGTAAAIPILDVLAVSGQTAPLQRWLNSAGTVLASVSSAGSITTSGTIQLGTFTVGTLPSAAANTRARAFVTDSNLSFSSANLGATVTAGGAILVPVLSNGTNWVIG